MANTCEIDSILVVAARYMLDCQYHIGMMSTLTKGGVAWTDELGAMADSLTKAGNQVQTLFDRLTKDA